MELKIFSDTANNNVSFFSDEISDYLEEKINHLYKNDNIKIGIAIRCLPDNYNRRSFTRYYADRNDLTVDFCLSMEGYEKMHKVEQIYDIGEKFIFWLTKGLANKKLIQNNPTLDTESLLQDIKKIGQEIGWFEDEIAWEKYLD